MKEIKRYNLEVVSMNEAYGFMEESEDGDYVKFSDVTQLQARIKELESAERTLNQLGYTNNGGEFWKPPVGKKPDFSLIDSLNERIKELESEKELAYQQGKNDAVDILLEKFPPDGDLSMLTKTVRYGEEYVEEWDVDRLNDFFKINQSITGVHQEFSEMVKCLYWNAVAIKDGYTDELCSPHSPNETEIKLKEFIDYKINEIKAKGIEEAVNRVAMDCMYDEDPVIVLTRFGNYAEQLRNKHD